MTQMQSKWNTYVENLRLKFAGEADLLFKGLSLHIPQGQKVLILGPSGSGKSTLLQVLSGIIPNSLAVPAAYDHIQLPSSWGFVFQDPDTQFCMSYVDEELAFVLENQQVPREDMDLKIKEALMLVGLQLDHLHTPIQQLSQGMKQRLALAAVLLLQPETVFLDEPSALLDPEGTVQIWDSVRSLLLHKTVIVVEHNINAVLDWIERIILFDNTGNIIADGEAQSIFQHYKAELTHYGIWYPNVWEEYIAARPLADTSEVLLHSLHSTQLDDASISTQASKHEPIIQLHNFKGFRGKECRISVQDATISAGSWIAITGANGAGKSSLLLALTQLIPTTGTYIIHNQEIKLTKKKQPVPAALSFVFQNPELQFIKDSIGEELAHSLAIFKENKRQIGPSVAQSADAATGDSHFQLDWNSVEEVLASFQLPVDASRHPYELSLGQKRKLSVLTALLESHSILLLDEPTFGQDAKNTFLLLEQLERLRNNGITIVMVTHDPKIVTHFATEEWVIDRGELLCMRPVIRDREPLHDEINK